MTKVCTGLEVVELWKIQQAWCRKHLFVCLAILVASVSNDKLVIHTPVLQSLTKHSNISCTSAM
eukprot:14408189-Ditylum_brightwellii.AAC.1